ncbi:parathyroid hormone-related protein-like isoform X1 [Xiphophorus maculatus]|uniref:Parathyroid hormone-like hormone a n=2 Tax=Xiphophorus maculatus TaxID=8083 RepID=M3ZKS9_XIPMA|nr:parathyroid hormone-related protein-like isoform X1 [Xiphophorus maculatus]
MSSGGVGPVYKAPWSGTVPTLTEPETRDNRRVLVQRTTLNPNRTSRTMLFSSSLLQRWFFAVFLLCSPVPFAGRPVDTLSGRMRRSVTHTQLMHDKSRMLQDFRRRMFLQGILDAVHTAEILPVRGAGGSSGAGAGPPGPGLGVNPSTTGSTLQSKPPGGTKNLPVMFQEEEEEEGTHLPQETNKSYKEKVPSKRKRKGKSGRRKEAEKRKRTVRAVRQRPGEEAGSGLHLEWRPLLGLQGALQ